MGKMRLKVDGMKMESFATAKDGEIRGTVLGLLRTKGAPGGASALPRHGGEGPARNGAV